MTEEEYRAEMAKQARIANLIALRQLAKDSAMISEAVGSYGIVEEILQELYVK